MAEPESERKPPQERAKLSEVIAGLVSGVAGARSIADAEALRIARYYRTHELLKGMPIPRLRFKRVAVSLPVVLKAFIPGVPAKINDPKEIARRTWEVLVAAIGAAREPLEQMLQSQEPTKEERRQCGFYLRLLQTSEKEYQNKTQELRDRLEADLRHTFLDLDVAEGGAKPSDSAVRESAATVVEEWFQGILRESLFVYVKNRVEDERRGDPKLDEFQPERARQKFDEVIKSDIIQGLITLLRHEAEDASVLSITIPPDFYVDVDTGIVKNTGGGPDSVTRLEMVLLEEGLEWLTETRDGVEHTKLSLE
jgi:hypothetical protein